MFVHLLPRRGVKESVVIVTVCGVSKKGVVKHRHVYGVVVIARGRSREPVVSDVAHTLCVCVSEARSPPWPGVQAPHCELMIEKFGCSIINDLHIIIIVINQFGNLPCCWCWCRGNPASSPNIASLSDVSWTASAQIPAAVLGWPFRINTAALGPSLPCHPRRSRPECPWAASHALQFACMPPPWSIGRLMRMRPPRPS